jgi:spermidine/putrescine-binding protein
MAAIMTDSDNPATPIKAMVEAGNVTLDVAWVEYADAIRLRDEGVLEPIDVNALPAGNDGVPATEDFFKAQSPNAVCRPTSGRTSMAMTPLSSQLMRHPRLP